jgi:hypothetical protein
VDWDFWPENPSARLIKWGTLFTVLDFHECANELQPSSVVGAAGWISGVLFKGPVFEPAEHVLDPVTLTIEDTVMFDRCFSV